MTKPFNFTLLPLPEMSTKRMPNILKFSLQLVGCVPHHI